jgi:hypothetical protein
VDDEDRFARGAGLGACIVETMQQFGVTMAPSEAAVDEHRNQVRIVHVLHVSV